MPLRLLVLSQHYWPESFRINTFVEQLRAQQVEVTVLTGQPNYPDGKTYPCYDWHSAGIERHPSGYAIYRVPLVPRGRGNHLRLALNYLSFIVSGCLWGRRLLKGRQFDAILVYGTSPILQGFIGVALRPMLKAKLVLWVQDIWPHVLRSTGYISNTRVLSLVEGFVKALYARADLILAQSEGFAEIIRQQVTEVPIEVFSNPGDRAASVDEIDEPSADATFEVVFAGNLGRAQALGTLLDAAQALRCKSDIRFTLYGGGALTEWVREEIAQRKLNNVELAGKRDPEEIPGILSKASAGLVTLVSDELVGCTVPSKLQTYLGVGVPIIISAGQEARKIVTDAGAGFACLPEDAYALAKAIVALRNTPLADRLEMRRAGRRYFAEHFDPETLSRQFVRRIIVLISN